MDLEPARSATFCVTPAVFLLSVCRLTFRNLFQKKRLSCWFVRLHYNCSAGWVVRIRSVPGKGMDFEFFESQFLGKGKISTFLSLLDDFLQFLSSGFLSSFLDSRPCRKVRRRDTLLLGWRCQGTSRWRGEKEKQEARHSVFIGPRRSIWCKINHLWRVWLLIGCLLSDARKMIAERRGLRMCVSFWVFFSMQKKGRCKINIGMALRENFAFKVYCLQ